MEDCFDIDWIKENYITCIKEITRITKNAYTNNYTKPLKMFNLSDSFLLQNLLVHPSIELSILNKELKKLNVKVILHSTGYILLPIIEF